MVVFWGGATEGGGCVDVGAGFRLVGSNGNTPALKRDVGIRGQQYTSRKKKFVHGNEL